jgi:hypothetical protein
MLRYRARRKIAGNIEGKEGPKEYSSCDYHDATYQGLAQYSLAEARDKVLAHDSD